ncbi:RNA exonuclease 4 [Chlorella vulgaris]
MRAKRNAEEQQLGSAKEAATAAVKKSRAHTADASAGSAPPALPPPISSNWAALQSAMLQQQAVSGRKPYRKRAADAKGAPVVAAVPDSRPQSIGGDTAPTRVVGLDCEMVGVGLDGQRSVLARVCVVNSAGNVLLDQYVRPLEQVTDFRTKVSGIRAADLRDAAAFVDVQRQVASVLDGRIIVGHALQNDLEVCRWPGVLQVLHPQLGSLVPALMLSHRRKDVRDTAKYPPLMKPQARQNARTGKLKPRALRHLAAEQLGLAIQVGEHSPVDDARAALYIYLKHRKEWERWHAGGKQQRQPHQQRQQHLSAAALAMADL